MPRFAVSKRQWAIKVLATIAILAAWAVAAEICTAPVPPPAQIEQLQAQVEQLEAQIEGLSAKVDANDAIVNRWLMEGN